MIFSLNSHGENIKKRFLDEFSSHLVDNHLHVVAPPGSGKTVLGLEVMLRLNQPALIIAPTIALKNQWIDRFVELFLQTEICPDWISGDLKNIQLITVATYQGIHSAMNGFTEENDSDEQKPNSLDSKKFLNSLQKNGIGTLILDEAHHLKNAWWKSLTELKEFINPTIVALTATPPFDVSPLEWKNYSELNGPVDVEISVPELMKEGDLCPHQDLVYFSEPTEIEQAKIEQIYQKAQDFFNEISNDEVFFEAISTHPIYQNPQQHLDWIYSNISSYTSGLVLINFKGIEINKIHFEIVGDEQKYVPEFNFFWLEEVLEFYFFLDQKHFESFQEHQFHLENSLRRNGFIENKKVGFFNNPNLNKILDSSIGKLDSISEISKSEFQNLQSDLRMVILTDFIRKEFITNEKINNLELNKVGSIPVFEKLRRERIAENKIAVLTGSLVILPKSIAQKLKDNEKKYPFSDLSYDENFQILNVDDRSRNNIVSVVTSLFQSGEILILIGTRSLLGEGWDAPKINTMILASFVSSFVQSNQMRGRSIRIDKSNPQKTSNIWHLISFDQHSVIGGNDFEKMERRFRTFVGISNDEETSIENNFERLKVPTIESSAQLKEINFRMIEFSNARSKVSEKWNLALAKGNVLVEEVMIPFDAEKEYNDLKYKNLGKSIKNLFFTLISTVLMFGADFLAGVLKGHKSFHSIHSVSGFIVLFGIAGFLTYGGMFYRTLIQYLKYVNSSKKLEKISKVVIHSLCEEGIFRTPIEQLSVVVESDKNGNRICYLQGGNQNEMSQFILTLQELFSPIDNPRYLIKNQGFIRFLEETDYYPVPELFGKNKKSAERFAKYWSSEVERAEVIFTRTIETRKLVLKLRFRNLTRKNKRIEHLQKWVR